MAVSLARVFGPVQLANGNSVPFTGVAGHKYAMRVFVVNTTGTARTTKAWIGGTGAGVQIVPTTTVPANGMISFVALIDGAETLNMNASAASALTAYAIGIDQT